MKIWRCDIYDPALGQLVSWHASERKARQALAAFRQERSEPASGPEGVSRIEIPTDKAGLLRWLNTHLTNDNG